MFNPFYSDIEWLDNNIHSLPRLLAWVRSDEAPQKGGLRYFLGPRTIQESEIDSCWVLFQPARSSINKSYVDYPEEIENSYLLKVKIKSSLPFTFSGKNGYEKYYTEVINTWYFCEVLEKVPLLDIPNKELISVERLPDYEKYQYVQRIDCKGFFIVDGDDQSYAGESSLFIVKSDGIYLTVHNKYFADEEESVCYNHKLSEQEILQLQKYKSNEGAHGN